MKDEVATVLRRIVARKYEEIERRQQLNPLDKVRHLAMNMSDQPRGFIRALKKSIAQTRPAVIAEIKKASPSKGVIREDFNVEKIALSYQLCGASCLSVLTDKDFFQGHESYLQLARKVCKLPVLRKEFIVEPYQVYETRMLRADCILLIAAIFVDKPEKLYQLADLSHELGLDVLLEVHNEREMHMALNTSCQLIGINNRDLHSFDTDIYTSLRLKKMLPDNRLLVTESGIHTRDDVNLMRDHDVHAFLVGEAFMRAANPGAALKQLFF